MKKRNIIIYWIATGLMCFWNVEQWPGTIIQMQKKWLI